MPVSCQKEKKNHLVLQRRNRTRRLKLKECTPSPSIKRTSQSSLRGNYGTLLQLDFTLSLFSSPFPNFTQSLILPAVFLFDLFFSSAVKVFIPTTFTHTLEFGTAQLVWFSADSQWDFFYVQRPERVQSHL